MCRSTLDKYSIPDEVTAAKPQPEGVSHPKEIHTPEK